MNLKNNMKKNINELQPNIKEISSETEKESGQGLEIVKGDELDKVGESIETLKDKIDHDTPVTGNDVLQIKETLNNLTIDVAGEKVPIGEVKDNKELKGNIEILKEIENGNFENIRKLTFITDKTAESLSKHEGWIWLNSLKSLSDNQAESLSKHEGWLSLKSLKSLSDNQAESLSKHEGGLFLKDDIKKQVDKFKK